MSLYNINETDLINDPIYGEKTYIMDEDEFYIGDYVFENINIKTFVINNENVNIGFNSFRNSRTLEKIIINSYSVKFRNYNISLYGCNNLTTIECPNLDVPIIFDPKDVEQEINIINNKVLYSKNINENEIYNDENYGSGTYIIPNNIRTLPDIYYLDKNTNIKTIIINREFINIYKDFFKFFEKLERIVFNVNSVSFVDDCFHYPNSLKKIIAKNLNEIIPFDFLNDNNYLNINIISDKYIYNINEYDIYDDDEYGEGTFILDREILMGEFNRFNMVNTLIIKYENFKNNVNFSKWNSIENIIFDIDIFDLNNYPLSFRGCTNLKEVIFPNEVINNSNSFKSCFMDCNNLEYVELPNNINKIGYEMFKNCISLENIEIPDNSNIDDSAFAGCINLKNIEFGNYDSGTGLEIGKYAFEGCESLESITLPIMRNAYLYISNGIFKNCKKLKEIINFDKNYIKANENISTLESIFEGCESLESITLPIYLNKFKKCFKNCYNLKNIIFNNSYLYFEESNFENCFSLKNIDISNLRSYEISHSLFENCISLESITIPENIESIKDKAFKNCSKLKNINFEVGYHLQDIGEKSFANCTNLENIEFPDSLMFLGTDCFKNCINLKNIANIPRYLTTITGFNGCSSLTNVIYNEYTECFEKNAFSNCNGLVNIDLSDSNIIKFENNAFSNCKNLESIILPPSLAYIGIGCFENCDKLTNLVINDNIKYIKENCFKNCDGIKNLFLPNTIEFLDYGAFENCKGLEKIEFLSNNENEVEIRDNCFKNCDKLKYIIFPTILKLIGEKSFENCISLENLNFPSGNIQIKNFAFNNCSKLTILNLKDIEEINSNSFSNCEKLKIINFNNVKKINELAFENCINLETLNFTNSIEFIDDDSFKNCNNIININIPNKYINIKDNAFEFAFNLNEEFENGLTMEDIEIKYNIDKYGKIIESSRYVDSYSYSESKGLETLDFSGNYNLTINEGAFENCNDIKTIIFNNYSVNIGKRAFFNCKNLENVIIKYENFCNKWGSSNGLRLIIDDEAFSFCTNLKSIKFEGFVNYYSDFSGTILPKIIVRKIGIRAFYNCTNLKDFVFFNYNEVDSHYTYNENMVGSIQSEAFSGCINLENLKLPIRRNFLVYDTRDVIYEEGPSNYHAFSMNSFNNCKKLPSINKNYKVLEMYYTPTAYISTSWYGDNNPNIRSFNHTDQYSASVGNYNSCLKIFKCKDKFFNFNEWSEEIENLELFKKGYHYSEKIHDVLRSYPLIINAKKPKEIIGNNKFLENTGLLYDYYKNNNPIVCNFIDELDYLHTERENNLNEYDGMNIHCINVLCEIEVGDNIIRDENTSICVTNKFKIIRIFNYLETAKLINGEDVDN